MPDPAVDVPIAIIGGGLGGLALAVGLARQKVPFRIYEAVSKFSEIGAGIACSTNALRAIGLISPELLEGFDKHATYNAYESYRNTWFTYRYGQNSRNGNEKKSGDLIFSFDEEQEWLKQDNRLHIGVRTSIHRARLLDELVKHIPDGVSEFGKSLETIHEDDASATSLLTFSDGTTVRVNAVIGADGIKSKTRKVVCQRDIKPNFCEEYGYRALVPREEAIAVLGEELATNGQIYCGYGAYIVSYPIEKGSLLNIVGVLRRPGSQWTHKEWVRPAGRDLMLQDFKGWHPGIMELYKRYSKCEQWALHNIVHPYPYARKRVCLLGDSAHASTPHQGAGGGMAMEDAYILSNLLGQFRDPKIYEAVFQAYDQVRRPRTQRLVASSQESGGLMSFMGENVGDDLGKLECAIKEGYLWIWHVDLEGDLKKAEDLVKDYMNGLIES